MLLLKDLTELHKMSYLNDLYDVFSSLALSDLFNEGFKTSAL
jgi:hypothetical protein